MYCSFDSSLEEFILGGISSVIYFNFMGITVLMVAKLLKSQNKFNCGVSYYCYYWRKGLFYD